MCIFFIFKWCNKPLQKCPSGCSKTPPRYQGWSTLLPECCNPNTPVLQSTVAFLLLFLPKLYASSEAADISCSVNGCSAERGVDFYLPWSLSSRSPCASCSSLHLPLCVDTVWPRSRNQALQQWPSLSHLVPRLSPTPPSLRFHLLTKQKSPSFMLTLTLSPPFYCRQTFADTRQMLLNIPPSFCSLCWNFVPAYSLLIFSEVPFFLALHDSAFLAVSWWGLLSLLLSLPLISTWLKPK